MADFVLCGINFLVLLHIGYFYCKIWELIMVSYDGGIWNVNVWLNMLVSARAAGTYGGIYSDIIYRGYPGKQCGCQGGNEESGGKLL